MNVVHAVNRYRRITGRKYSWALMSNASITSRRSQMTRPDSASQKALIANVAPECGISP